MDLIRKSVAAQSSLCKYKTGVVETENRFMCLGFADPINTLNLDFELFKYENYKDKDRHMEWFACFVKITVISKL